MPAQPRRQRPRWPGPRCRPRAPAAPRRPARAAAGRACARSAVSSRPSATIRRYPSGRVAVRGAPGSQIASARHGGVGVGGGLRDDPRRPMRRSAGGPADLDPGRPRAATAPRCRGRRAASAGRSAPASRPRRPVGSATSRSIATTSATSGDGEQPAEPDHLDRHTAGGAARRPSARRRRCAAPAPRRSAAAGRRSRASCVAPRAIWSATQSRSARDVAQQRAADRPRSAPGPRPQRAHRHRPAPRLGRHRVGQVQRLSAGCASWCAAPASARGCRPNAGSRWRTAAGWSPTRRASRRSTGSGRRPRSARGRRRRRHRTATTARPAARDRCPGTRRAAPPGSVAAAARRPRGHVDASRAAAAICMPKSITFSARMRSCNASISGTSSVRSVWVASIRSSHWLGPRSR